MRNLKISKKVSLVFLAVLIIAAIPVVAVLVSAGNMSRTTMENHYIITEPLDYFVRFSTAFGNVRVAMRDIAYTDDPEASARQADTINTNLDVAVDSLRSYYSIMEARHSTHSERFEMVRTAYYTMVEYSAAVRTYIIPLGLANENQQVLANIPAHITPYGNIVRDIVAVLTEMKTAEGDASAALMERNTNIIRILGVTLGALALIFLIFAANYIIKSVAKPIERIADNMNEMANGNLNVNIDESFRGNKDEIGMLTENLCAFSDVIKNMINDLTRLNCEFSVNGDIEYKIDAAKYRNSFNEMMESINATYSAMVGDVMMVLNVLNRISAGEFDAEVADMPGKKMVLPETIRNVTANLQNVNTEIGGMIESVAVKGNLHFRVDAAKHSGGWQRIMTGLNKIVDAVDVPIIEMRYVMENLARGDFTYKITSEYKGHFKQMSDSANNTVTTFNQYISDINEDLSQIASGNLTTRLTRDFVGDFSAIKESLNNISEKLHSTMSGISSATASVQSGASQISDSANSLAIGATEQAVSVQELNDSIEIITEKTRQNANNALEANTLSTKSTVNAKEGNEAMKKMFDAMMQIKESSNNISGIVKVIQDIAFQTNLLSLNASVEAARAGEHGKGFAVVAEEVRNLAARSQTAATETTELIESSIGHVEIGSEISETTAKILNTIVSSADEVLQTIGSISDSSREQAEAVATISGSIGQISKVVQTNSATSEETAAAAQELNSQSTVLRELVGYFRL